MINETITLSCRFRDTLGKSRSLNISQPKENLTPEEIEAFMEMVIDTNILMPATDSPDVQLISINNATLTHRSTETITF